MKKVLQKTDLLRTCSRLRVAGKKIVFTNGCFDILHIGHVRYLAKAKKLGDILVVGLNADKSVSRIKPGRPVNNEKARAEVLAALSSVDYVTIFTEPTPYRLIKSLKPDILVKGGDWKEEEIVGSDIAGQTFSLPYTRGASTTGIIGKILKSSL
jgi:D-beta-D-heptose 7-phosphate kinase/D-beta-D-heptose 1-phosphate adenosyltransferase